VYRGSAQAGGSRPPWSWQGCYWDHEPQAEVELLRRGFHIAFITPDPGKPWDAWYAWLTEKHGLSKKPAFVGMSNRRLRFGFSAVCASKVPLQSKVPASSRQIQFVANFDFEVIFDISTVRSSSVQPHPQATPTGCGEAGLAGFFPDSARMISRMNSTASWAFLCANSIPTVSPFTTGNGWQSS
jgi:hypothetical protein